MSNTSKLKKLCEIEGISEMEMLENATFDGSCPAICMNKNCNATYDYEPDQNEGWCEECQTNSVKSCLILAGLI